MALGYIAMPEGSKAPAPTKAAVKAAARGAGDLTAEYAGKAADKIQPVAERIADAAEKAARQAADAFKRATDRRKD